MTIVVDANVIAATAIDVPYSSDAVRKLDSWRQEHELLIAPILFEYELATIIRRVTRVGRIEETQAPGLLSDLLNLGVVTIAPDEALHLQSLELAKRVNQSKAYDAHYLALASRENAAFWTADQRLAEAAQTTGLTWVHWIGE